MPSETPKSPDHPLAVSDDLALPDIPKFHGENKRNRTANKVVDGEQYPSVTSLRLNAATPLAPQVWI